MHKEIREIANHYGIENQSKQACQELAELIAELTRGGGVDGIVQELADVEIMLEQIKYLYKIDVADLDTWKQFKVLRTLERMQTVPLQEGLTNENIC